jgi:hypothetical protein
MKQATPESVKPGVWLRTRKEDRRYYPDILFKCKTITWKGDGHPDNYIESEVFYDYEGMEWIFDDPAPWEHIADMGLSSEESEWDELLGSYFVYESDRELIEDMMENPIEEF